MTASDLKNFQTLEDKIKLTISLVGKLKSETVGLKAENAELNSQNAALKAEMVDLKSSAELGSAAKGELETMKLTSDQLSRELTDLRSERQTVITRVDGILESLSALSLD